MFKSVFAFFGAFERSNALLLLVEVGGTQILNVIYFCNKKTAISRASVGKCKIPYFYRKRLWHWVYHSEIIATSLLY
jgi:hypothetical protein